MECNEHWRQLLPGPTICIVGFIVNVVGLSSDYWSTLSSSGAHAGLWNVCTKGGNNDVSCFVITHRGSVPTIVFISSFLQTISTVLAGVACLTAMIAMCQRNSGTLKWSKHSASISLLSVLISGCCECIYGASFRSITYDNIPYWTKATRADKLGWSFFTTCASSGIILVGSIYLIVVPPQLLTTNKVADGSPQVPVLQIHPPPSDRTPTPLFLLSQRSSSPLPSPFTGKSTYPQQQRSLPPVFTQLKR